MEIIRIQGGLSIFDWLNSACAVCLPPKTTEDCPMKKSFLCLATLVAAGVAALAQPGPGSPTAGLDASLNKLFGNNPAFSAKGEIKTTGDDGVDMTMTMNFTVLDNKVRSDVNMADIKSASIPPDAVASMKQMGIDRVVSIIRPDLKLLYLIYPGMKAYAKMPLPKEATLATNQEPPMDKTLLGKETIDGHPCEKNKVVMTTAPGQKQEFTTWNATDLKGFPIQIQAVTPKGTVLLHYRDIKFEKPDVKQFEPPGGYTAYDDIQQMMMSAMQKMIPPSGNK
jgi:hypothetical protein